MAIRNSSLLHSFRQDKLTDLEALLRVPYIEQESGYDISPDGAKIAFAWNITGHWEIYELPLCPIDTRSEHSGSESSSPRQVTHGPGAKFAPRYSPNGKFLAYIVDFDGSEQFHLFIYDFALQQENDLTPSHLGVSQPNLSWSADSSQIAFISGQSGHFNTFTTSLREGLTHLVVDSPHPDQDIRWSPDGNWLAIITEISGQDHAAIIVSRIQNEIQSIADNNGPLNVSQVYWFPDSSRLAFCSDAHGFYNIGIYEVITKKLTWLTQGKGDKLFPCLSPDCRSLAYIHTEDGASKLAILDVVKAAPVMYQIEPGMFSWPRFTPDGNHLIVIFESPRRPPDLWSLSMEDGSFRQLSFSLPANLEHENLVFPTAIHYPGLDGQDVPGLLFKPDPPGELPPGIIFVHGGPNWHFQFIWYPIVQHMVLRGWVILAPNYRGSTGYGRKWQLANRYDLGGVDTRDVTAGALYLINQRLANPKRIAITGRSHGGYLTMTALTQYPNLWAAGSAIVPFLNWFTAHANAREDLKHWDIENFGDPEQNRDLWIERSPYFFLDRLNAPVQLICGANDPRCPASESIAARDALLSLGKFVNFVLYPDEGHSFLKTENIISSEQQRVAFLAQELEK
jgi:dipeptidyl aminopeptidase/acylaminoacyl peptidase